MPMKAPLATAAAALGADVLFRFVRPAFSGVLGYFQEKSLRREGFENSLRITVDCHSFCPQCLSFYFHTMFVWMELNLEAGGQF